MLSSMSTEFRTADTDEWVCTRWFKRTVADAGGQAFDFGSAERFARLEQAALGGDVTLVDEEGHTCSLFDLLVAGTAHQLLGRRLVATFGEFGGTVAVGSGEWLDRLGLGD